MARRPPPPPPGSSRSRGVSISAIRGTLHERRESAAGIEYRIDRTWHKVAADADRVLRLASPGASVGLSFVDGIFRTGTIEEIVATREIESPARYNEETGAERDAQIHEIPIVRTRRVEAGRVVSTYTASLPPGVKNRPFEISDDDRPAFAAALAAAVSEVARTFHGDGGRDYHEQHFAGLFAGTMYGDTTTDERGERQVVGTFAGTDAAAVTNELASRLERVLEGQPPSSGDGGGKGKGYGKFSAGPQEVAMMVTETLDLLEELIGLADATEDDE